MTIAASLVAGLAASVPVGYAAPANGVVANVVENLEPSVDQRESVVVSLATDPQQDPEAACVALQIGMNLLMNDLDQDGEADAIPADDVTLFVTLDGVYLVAPDLDFGSTLCTTPKNEKSLADLLQGFQNAGGEVLVCPLCWKDRGYGPDPSTTPPTPLTPPASGGVANAFDIHELFLYADKVISF
jgi:hypothetical protein